MNHAQRLKAAFDACPFDTEPMPIKRTQDIPSMAAVPSSPDKGFPIDIYPDHIAASFKEIAANYNIPLDYLGLTALFTVAGLSGGMYRGELNGGIKPILYACLVGPSGVGKTPPYKQLCEYIIAPLRAEYYKQYKAELKAYQEERELAKNNKMPFTKDPPVKKVRMITDATLEALTKYAELCPAGFGVVYDEGGRFFTSANAYKKDTSSVDFWNELWNGTAYEILRVDAERDRHISQSATSVIIGMQRDRLLKYFNEDTVASGLLNRFLIVESDYILLNENPDPFAPKGSVHDGWQDLVKYLFTKGIMFTPGTENRVPFEEIAKKKFSEISNALIRESNMNILSARKDDSTRLMIAYNSKLVAYFPRLALILSIINNPRKPIIKYEDVENAKRLYDFFKENAKQLLATINEQTATGLTENQRKLYDNLPVKFTSSEAKLICEELNLSQKFFLMNYQRVFSKGMIGKGADGFYFKIGEI